MCVYIRVYVCFMRTSVVIHVFVDVCASLCMLCVREEAGVNETAFDSHE